MYLEYYGIFGRYALTRLSLKYKIVLKSIPNSRTRVDPEWADKLQQEKAIGF